MRSPDEDPNAGVTNILDFRPDLQLTTSSAVVLSARFPFITPPGVITRNATIEVPDSGIFEKIKALELTDGGFYDNSGAFVAGDIVREMARLLEKDADFAVFSKKVRLHVIRFTDTPAKRQVEVSEGAHFELMTPLVAYDAVRLSRGVRLPRFFGTTTFDIQLLDDWYNGTLNWLLSQKTKDAVQLRSAWDQGSAKGDCCAVQGLGIERPKQRKLEPKDEEYLKQRGYSVDRIVPNKEKFEQIFALLKEGAEPTRSHLVRPSESPQ